MWNVLIELLNHAPVLRMLISNTFGKLHKISKGKSNRVTIIIAVNVTCYEIHM